MIYHIPRSNAFINHDKLDLNRQIYFTEFFQNYLLKSNYSLWLFFNYTLPYIDFVLSTRNGLGSSETNFHVCNSSSLDSFFLCFPLRFINFVILSSLRTPQPFSNLITQSNALSLMYDQNVLMYMFVATKRCSSRVMR